MMKLRDAIQRESENLLNLLMLESGKLRSHAAFETGSLTGYLSFFLEQAKSEHTQGISCLLYTSVRRPARSTWCHHHLSRNGSGGGD